MKGMRIWLFLSNYERRVQSKIEKVPRGIRDEKSSKDMASSRNLVSPKSVRNSCVIKVFGGVFMLSRCFLDCSVCVGVFVTGLSQISSFFSTIGALANPKMGDETRCPEG